MYVTYQIGLPTSIVLVGRCELHTNGQLTLCKQVMFARFRCVMGNLLKIPKINELAVFARQNWQWLFSNLHIGGQHRTAIQRWRRVVVSHLLLVRGMLWQRNVVTIGFRYFEFKQVCSVLMYFNAYDKPLKQLLELITTIITSIRCIQQNQSTKCPVRSCNY